MAKRTCAMPECDGDVVARGWCRHHYNRWYHNGDPAKGAPTAPADCLKCGSEIERTNAVGPAPSYCSSGCRNAASYERQKAAGRRTSKRNASHVVTCAQCSVEFEAVRVDARLCSKRCRSAWSRASESGECSDMGCDRPIRAKGLCNKHYKAAMRREGRLPNPPWDERRKARWKVRDAIKRGAADAESFEYREVFERDGWMCGICGESVDPTLCWPDPFSASLDHVTPLSLGGSHRRDNAQCSHLRCNVAKGNRVA